jgi:hypothetical protein
VIPANQIDPRMASALTQYLRTEITQSLNDRAPLEERWNRYLTAYRAMPLQETKRFPFEGAANLTLPVIATDVDTVYSRLMGILFASENLWSCRPLNDLMVNYAPRLQEFLQWAQTAELNVYPAIADWLMEKCKLGTGILKTRYCRESKRVYQFRETDRGTIEQIAQLMIKDHPVVQHVSLFDFLIPAGSYDIQLAPWVAERLSLTWGQLQNRVAAGIYQNVPNLGSWWARDRGARQTQVMEALDAYSPGIGDKFELWECWLDYDISGIGEPMALVATIHLPTMSILRIDYNPFFNQEKPYSDSRYLRQEKRFYGIGLCEMLDQFQDEISTMHNQRLDNATLLNSTMFKARKNIGIKQDEPVFPGRWFLLDNLEDVQPMSMGQKYDSTVPNEQLSLSYATRRTGVTDYVSGADNPSIGYGTATTAVQQLREGTKRFDQVLRECRRCLGIVGTQVVELYQQFNQHGKEYMAMGPRDGQAVHQILQFPLELIRTSIGVELTATSAALNKEVEIRTNQMIMQMLMQFYAQIMQGASYMVNPQMPPQIVQLAQEMVQGGTILMRRILDSYGVQDADQLIPTLQGLVNNGNQQLTALANAASGAAPAGPRPYAAPGVGPSGQSYPGAGPVGLQQAGYGGQPQGVPAFAR